MRRNRALAVAAREMLCRRLPVRPLCPEEMLGSMAAIILPEENAVAGGDGSGAGVPPRRSLAGGVWRRSPGSLLAARAADHLANFGPGVQ